MAPHHRKSAGERPRMGGRRNEEEGRQRNARLPDAMPRRAGSAGVLAVAPNSRHEPGAGRGAFGTIGSAASPTRRPLGGLGTGAAAATMVFMIILSSPSSPP